MPRTSPILALLSLALLACSDSSPPLVDARADSARDAAGERWAADAAPREGARLDSAPPVKYTPEPGGGRLENTLVVARAFVDGSLEVGRVGAAPFVLNKDPSDPQIVCLTIAGSGSCGSSPTGPDAAKASSQQLLAVGALSCLRTTFSGLTVDGKATSIDLLWDICLAPGSDEVLSRLEAKGESAAAALSKLYFPYAPRLSAVGKGYAVLPLRHGVLLPVGWLHEYPYWTAPTGGQGAKLAVEWEALSTGWTMPFLGVVEDDGRALYVEVRTAPDTLLRIEQPLGGAPRATVAQRAALGRFAHGGVRELAFVPLAAADHVTVAARYRQRALATGRHVSLSQKLAAQPALARLIGGAEINVPIFIHQNRTGGATYLESTFGAAAAELSVVRTATSEPITKGLVHVDGWGQRGYDNLHPDVILPATECVASPGGATDCGTAPGAGGFAGLGGLVQAATSGGFLLALHDNYRDFYLDAPSYNGGASAVVDAAGALPAAFDFWDGGPQQILCASRALPYLKRTLDLLQQKSASPTAYYLDVFSAVGPDECGHPNHRMTRAESLDHRVSLLQELAGRGIVASSEEAADWAVPHIAHVFWSGYQRQPNPAASDWSKRYGFNCNTPLGVPVPLVDLVYHDALVVPWPLLQGDRGDNLLDGWLSAGIAEVDLRALRQARIRQEVRLQGTLHEALGTRAMIGHRFLDDRYMAQEAKYYGGAVLSQDRSTLTVGCQGVAGIPDGTRSRAPRYRVTARIKSSQFVAPDKLQLALEWTTADSLAALAPHTVFLHALAADGKIVVNADHAPATATPAWPVGGAVQDAQATFTFTSDGTFDVVSGLYAVAGSDAIRLPIETPLASDMLPLGKVTVKRGVSITVDDRPTAEARLVLARVAGATDVEVMTEWMVEQAMPTQLRIFFHALDGTGAIVANRDYDPQPPVDKWPAGARRREQRRTFQFSAAQIPGSYTLVTGMFNTATLERVGFRGADAAKQLVLGKITLGGAAGKIGAVRFCPPTITCP